MDNQEKFVGRKAELQELDKLLEKTTASLAVIKGRRRIGKSRLIAEFAKKHRFLSFSGLIPEDDTTAQSQREEFTRQLSLQLDIPGLKADDWGNLFYLLAKETNKGRVIILFDEISWMGSKDPDFLGKLKIAWDLYFKKNPKLVLVLCGSVSSWIEKNILSSSAFLGRISFKLTLEEFSLEECNLFFQRIGFKGSSYERLLYLSLTGGVPWYLELLRPKDTIIENITRLCFKKEAVLVEEFKRIFHDLFDSRSDIYKKIVEALSTGKLEYNEIIQKINYHSGGSLSAYLDDLLEAGFISRDYIWSLKSAQKSRLSQFRLSDNYLRFYLRFIEPNLDKISKNKFKNLNPSNLPAWNTVLGLQFENLVLNNREVIINALGINFEDIVMDDPYFQRKTTKQSGCQIDYLIQTKYKTLFVCEIKFSRNEIKSDVIAEVKEKLKRIKIPKGFSLCPVLIHAGDISNAVLDADYFVKIIDFG